MSEPNTYPTVAEYADENNVSVFAVRRAIASRHLKLVMSKKTKTPSRPWLVCGGGMPLTNREFKEALLPAIEKHLRKGTHGFDSSGALHVMVGSKTLRFGCGDRNMSVVERVKSDVLAALKER